MAVSLLGLTLVWAFLDWAAIARGWQRAKYVTKPATLLALIAWFTLAAGWGGVRLWFGLALVFSLAGDVLLMLPGSYFLGGLASFLTAHVCYVIGLNPTLPPLQPAGLGLLVLVLAGAAFLYRRIQAGLRDKPGGCRLRLPVAFYSLAITLMLSSALLTPLRPDWALAPALLAAGGGLLFYTSDTLLAFDRFLQPIPNGRLLVRISYHLGQLGLIAGVVWRG